MTVPNVTVLKWRLRVDEIGSGKNVVLQVPEASLGPLAEVIGVDRILASEARLRVEPASDSAFDVAGTVTARCVQTCGVTLEPFEADLSETIGVRFAAAAKASAESLAYRNGDDEEGSAGMVDLPEPIVDGMLDLGGITQEFLALAVDPYPRKPDVNFEPIVPEDPEPSPFAALAKLRSRGEAGGDD